MAGRSLAGGAKPWSEPSVARSRGCLRLIVVDESSRARSSVDSDFGLTVEHANRVCGQGACPCGGSLGPTGLVWGARRGPGADRLPGSAVSPVPRSSLFPGRPPRGCLSGRCRQWSQPPDETGLRAAPGFRQHRLDLTANRLPADPAGLREFLDRAVFQEPAGSADHSSIVMPRSVATADGCRTDRWPTERSREHRTEKWNPLFGKIRCNAKR
ncbi:hypothetical protein FG93_05279 [Bosea sp. LC85]|nr:hypothetical protein FG93_05279 [Bosea sp. LC85]